MTITSPEGADEDKENKEPTPAVNPASAPNKPAKDALLENLEEAAASRAEQATEHVAPNSSTKFDFADTRDSAVALGLQTADATEPSAGHRVYHELRTTENTYESGLKTLTAGKSAVEKAYDNPSVKPGLNDLSKTEAIQLMTAMNSLGVAQVQLTAALKNPDPKQWAQALKGVEKNYSEYAVLHQKLGTKPIPPEVERAFKDATKDMQKAAWIIANGNDPAKPFTSPIGLGDHFILPVQRIPRYAMLATEMLKRAPESGMSMFLDQTKQTSMAMNETVRKAEQNAKYVDTMVASLNKDMPRSKDSAKGIFVSTIIQHLTDQKNTSAPQISIHDAVHAAILTLEKTDARRTQIDVLATKYTEKLSQIKNKSNPSLPEVEAAISTVDALASDSTKAPSRPRAASAPTTSATAAPEASRTRSESAPAAIPTTDVTPLAAARSKLINDIKALAHTVKKSEKSGDNFSSIAISAIADIMVKNPSLGFAEALNATHEEFKKVPNGAKFLGALEAQDKAWRNIDKKNGSATFTDIRIAIHTAKTLSEAAQKAQSTAIPSAIPVDSSAPAPLVAPPSLVTPEIVKTKTVLPPPPPPLPQAVAANNGASEKSTTSAALPATQAANSSASPLPDIAAAPVHTLTTAFHHTHREKAQDVIVSDTKNSIAHIKEFLSDKKNCQDLGIKVVESSPNNKDTLHLKMDNPPKNVYAKANTGTGGVLFSSDHPVPSDTVKQICDIALASATPGMKFNVNNADPVMAKQVNDYLTAKIAEKFAHLPEDKRPKVEGFKQPEATATPKSPKASAS